MRVAGVFHGWQDSAVRGKLMEMLGNAIVSIILSAPPGGVPVSIDGLVGWIYLTAARIKAGFHYV